MQEPVKSIGWECLVLTSMDRDKMVFVIKEGGRVRDRGVGRKNFLPLSLFPFSLSFHSCVCVCVRVCVCVCVLLAASILNVVDGSLKLKKGSLNSGPIEFFLWKKNAIVES